MNIFTDFIQNANISYVLVGVAALLAISFHEASHGFIAYQLGDPTAKKLGRLTLNPLKHLDIFGLIMLIVAGFGWAKPVPVDTRYFKSPKSGMALTALAGPVSNFLMAFMALLCVAALLPMNNGLIVFISDFLIILANINVGLGVFNLIPLPPLDGSKILFSCFPNHIYDKILEYERYGIIAMIILLSTGIASPFLSFARSIVFSGLWFLAKTPFQWLYGY